MLRTICGSGAGVGISTRIQIGVAELEAESRPNRRSGRPLIALPLPDWVAGRRSCAGRRSRRSSDSEEIAAGARADAPPTNAGVSPAPTRLLMRAFQGRTQGGFGVERDVADLVDHDQRDEAEAAELCLKVALTFVR